MTYRDTAYLKIAADSLILRDTSENYYKTFTLKYGIF